MRFLLACFLLLSPILVMGNLEKVLSKYNADPASYSKLSDQAINWLDADGPTSGSAFEAVKAVYHRRARGQEITAEVLAGWINNDMKNIKGQ